MALGARNPSSGWDGVGPWDPGAVGDGRNPSVGLVGGGGWLVGLL